LDQIRKGFDAKTPGAARETGAERRRLRFQKITGGAMKTILPSSVML
jgi:hypothetical protein